MNSNTRKAKIVFLTLSALLILSSFMLSGCSEDPTGKTVQKQEKYKIGVILPLSGTFAYYGEKVVNAIEISKEKIPGLADFEFIIEDDGGEPKNAVSAAKKLVTVDCVDVLMAVRSSTSSAVAPVAEEYKTPLLYVASVEEPAKNNRYAFDNFINIKNDCAEIAKILKGQKGRFMGHNMDSSLACINGFSAQGFFLEPNLFSKEEVDFRTMLVKIKNDAPDFIVLRGDKQTLPRILKQMNELQMNNITIICPHITGGGCNEPESIVVYSDSFKNALGTDIYVVKNKEINEFDRLFMEKFNSTPIDFSYAFYESLGIISSVVDKCQGEPDCFVESMTNATFQGLEGELLFDEYGLVTRETNILHFDGKQWTLVS